MSVVFLFSGVIFFVYFHCNCSGLLCPVLTSSGHFDYIDVRSGIGLDMIGNFGFSLGNSKWIEVFAMKTTTAKATIETLEKTINYGLMDRIVTDNGPKYTSEEF